MKKYLRNESALYVALFVALVLSTVYVSSCSNDLQGQSNTLKKNIVSETKDPESVVREFKELIDAGKIEEANKLTDLNEPFVPLNNPEKIGKIEEVPGKLDWASVLEERELIVETIIGSKTLDGQATVDTILRHREISKISFLAIFTLRFSNEKWLIHDIKFVTSG